MISGMQPFMSSSATIRAGLAIIEWVNILQNTSEQEVRKIADDATARLNKCIAATQLLADLPDALVCLY